MNPIKLIVTHKGNLQWKYGSKLARINAVLKKMQVADKKKGLDTKIVFIDDDASTKKDRGEKDQSLVGAGMQAYCR